ncbi:hypothetical protein ABZ439_32550 [Streptomyces sp. NPDC005840]|uniref:Uncharacterized protein n=1 Tax=Streptomyces doudnae TaxID=3075536 RepID=A0ABD5EHD3_9ACTN|nr:hypothetical protein [Streptomyces sp. DSM 41981]MDT0433804.1 hypothetical protein [Streptomyces sp. DSM 41981]
MGRLTARAGRLTVSTRLTWTFSARTAVRPARRPRRALAAGRAVTGALLRGALGAARARRRTAAAPPARAHRPWRR